MWSMTQVQKGVDRLVKIGICSEGRHLNNLKQLGSTWVRGPLESVSMRSEYSWNASNLPWRFISFILRANSVSEACKAHGHQLYNEQSKNNHKADSLYPRITDNGTGETLVGQCFMCWSQELKTMSTIKDSCQRKSWVSGHTCMNAVATITPEPKYLEIKRIHEGIPTPLRLAANTGNHVPKKEPIRITKIAEMRTPMRPSKSLSVGHSDIFGARSETGKECSKLVKTKFQGAVVEIKCRRHEEHTEK